MDAVQKANAGHPGTAMALAPLAYLLYTRGDASQPGDPHWPDRDRFVLSAGHAAVLQYSALHLTGYNLSLEELKRFRQWQSATPGHPEFRHTEGIEVTTGPLGQGFANGVGMAIAERFLADKFNRPHDRIVDHRVYAICSDGDLMEGVSYESASLAGTNALGKLVYFYDDNHITIDGTTSISFTEDRAKRFEALGWHVQHVHDANDLDALRDAIANAQRRDRRAVDRDRALAHRVRRAEGRRHGEGARLPARRGRGRRDEEGARLGSRQALLRPRRGLRAHEPGRRAATSSRPSGSAASRRGRRRSRATARRGTPRGQAGSAPGRCPTSSAGESLATRDAGKEVDAGVQARRADDDRRRRRPRRVDEDRVRGRRALLRPLVGPQHRVRHPRARDGLDRQRDRGTRRLRQAVRLDVPHLQRLHAPGRAPLGADGAAGRRGCGRTTRSGSARTARRTSRSRRTQRCARSRTSGSCGRPTRTRPP